MYPENSEGTRVILGSMNMEYVSDTARTRTRNLFRPKCVQIPLGHSDGVRAMSVEQTIYTLSYRGLLPDTASSTCSKAVEIGEIFEGMCRCSWWEKCSVVLSKHKQKPTFWNSWNSALQFCFTQIRKFCLHLHHHQLNVHFHPRLNTGMDGCFPTA